MITILVVDDHRLVRVGIRRLLEEQKDFKVVAEAANGKEALKLVRKHSPDVVLMDLFMPEMDGMETTKQMVKQDSESPRVVMLTMCDDAYFAARCLRAGAFGYLPKGAASTELIEAVRTVHQGKRFVSPGLREAMALRVVDGLDEEPLELLTDREFEVLRRLASGMRNVEVAEEFSVSVKTIDAHRMNMLAKLGLRNNAEATKFAIHHGIIQP